MISKSHNNMGHINELGKKQDTMFLITMTGNKAKCQCACFWVADRGLSFLLSCHFLQSDDNGGNELHF